MTVPDGSPGRRSLPSCSGLPWKRRVTASAGCWLQGSRQLLGPGCAPAVRINRFAREQLAGSPVTAVGLDEPAVMAELVLRRETGFFDALGLACIMRVL